VTSFRTLHPPYRIVLNSFRPFARRQRLGETPKACGGSANNESGDKRQLVPKRSFNQEQLRSDLCSLDRLTGEAETEALDEPRDALGVHLEFVPGAQVSQDLRLGPGDAPQVDEFGEELFEAGGGDDL
jgi:hypothetical protein